MPGEQGLVIAGFGDPAAVHDDDLVGHVNGAEAVRDQAVIVLYAVLFGARRGAVIGRPPGSTPLSRLALEVMLRGMRP